MDTNTVAVIEKFGEKMDSFMGTLAEKAGVATDHFWPIFVQQQVISGYTSLGIAFFFVCIAAGLFLLGWVIRNKEETVFGDHQHGTTVFFTIISIAICVIVGIALGVSGPDVVGKILNPEFYAVQSLAQMLR